LNRVIARLKAERETRVRAPLAPPNEKAKNPVGLAAPVHEERQPPDLIALDGLMAGLAPESLIYERLAAITKLRAHQVKINLHTLQQLSPAREEARPGLTAARFTAGMATMLGLLGTFIGLANMIQGIQFALPHSLEHGTWESWMQSMSNVFGVLSGIKTAFSTSLVGMFCAVLSTFAGARLQRAQAVFFERLERFTTEDLLPATVPVVEEETLLEAVSLKLENSFSLLQEIYEQNQSALKDLIAAQEAFVAMIGEVRQITRSNASRNLDRVIEQLDQTNRSVLSVVEHLPKIGNAIEAANRRLFERMSEAFHSLAPPNPELRSGPTLPWPLAALLAALGFFLVFLLSKSVLR